MASRTGVTAKTTGPLLDWFYVSAGYVTFRSGIAEQWDSPSGIEIEVQQAEKSDPILEPDRPWEEGGIASVKGITRRNGRYEMYYSTISGCQCLAVSEDGAAWTKPDLGVVEFDGSTRNNIVARGPGLTGYVFEDPSAPPGERFKMTTMRGGIYEPELDADGMPVELGPTAFDDFERQEELREGYTGKWGQMKGFLAGAVSPDGLRWTAIDRPLLAEFVDGDNITHYDDATGRYVGYLRFHTAERRTIGRSETADFRRFSPEKVVLQADPQDPPDTSFYGHAYTRYPGRDDLHLMFRVRLPPQHRQHRPAARREPRRRLLVPARPPAAHRPQRARGYRRLRADPCRPRPRRDRRRPVGPSVRRVRPAAQQRHRLVPARARRYCGPDCPLRRLAAGPAGGDTRAGPGTAHAPAGARPPSGELPRRDRGARLAACSRRCSTRTRRPGSSG